MKRGELARAEGDFIRAIALRPEDPMHHFLRAVFYQRQKRYDLALPDYDRAIAIAPRMVNAHLNRAAIYRAEGRPKAALAGLRTVLELAPSHRKRTAILADIAALEEAIKKP